MESQEASAFTCSKTAPVRVSSVKTKVIIIIIVIKPLLVERQRDKTVTITHRNTFNKRLLVSPMDFPTVVMFITPAILWYAL